MTLKEILYHVNIILPIITGLGCFIFSIWNIILSSKNKKLEDKIDNIKYWIAAIDINDFRSHDKNYINKIKRILEV